MVAQLAEKPITIDYLTVEEYANRFDMKETTVRTWLNRGKLNKVYKDIDGVRTVVIAVEDLPDDPVNNSGLSMNDSDVKNEQFGELFSRITDLEKENAVLKVRTEMLDQLVESKQSEVSTLKSALMLSDKRIKELEQYNPFKLEDKTIEYEPKQTGFLSRVKKWFG